MRSTVCGLSDRGWQIDTIFLHCRNAALVCKLSANLPGARVKWVVCHKRLADWRNYLHSFKSTDVVPYRTEHCTEHCTRHYRVREYERRNRQYKNSVADGATFFRQEELRHAPCIWKSLILTIFR